MSLHCYPLGARRAIELDEQPLAMAVAYADDLFVCAVDHCRQLAVFELAGEARERAPSSPPSSPDSWADSWADCSADSSPPSEGPDLAASEPRPGPAAPAGRPPPLLSQFALGPQLVLDQVVHCATGDYLACVGHRHEGSLAVLVAFGWRSGGGAGAQVRELAPAAAAAAALDSPSSIDCCQRTGNLAVSCGETLLVYRLAAGPGGELEAHSFELLLSVKLSLWPLRVELVENYLCVTALDHVQVLRLELLTLQLQASDESELDSDGSQLAGDQVEEEDEDEGGPAEGPLRRGPNQRQSRRQRHQDDDSGLPADEPPTWSPRGARHAPAPAGARESPEVASPPAGQLRRSASSTSDFFVANGWLASATAGSGAQQLACAATCSLTSDLSATSELSSLNLGALGTLAGAQQTSAAASPGQEGQLAAGQPDQQASEVPASGSLGRQARLSDDCISWNLNTGKLVRLPSLMHNTSSNLSSFHVCHPLELLGPACESVACRAQARLHASGFCANQLAPVVLLCKQLDFDRDPLKSARLEPLYLSSAGHAKRLGWPGPGAGGQTGQQLGEPWLAGAAPAAGPLQSSGQLGSLSCFVATLSSCFVYSLLGPRVQRLQTITLPGLCVDLRPDLLNVLLLTPAGLQVCSTGAADALFRYDWSSAAELNLSFRATDGARVLASRRHLLLVGAGGPSCSVQVWRKPSLEQLRSRILHTVEHCQSVSLRCNLLSYLHASGQLELMARLPEVGRLLEVARSSSAEAAPAAGQQSAPLPARHEARLLAQVRASALMLCKHLAHKKQTNPITNAKIDKTVKHLLEISCCTSGGGGGRPAGCDF